MTAKTLDLLELLATRLCHDLAGPLSGLSVALSEVPRDPEALPLAQEALLALRRRFALVRAAWGIAPPALSAAEIGDLALGLANAHRLRVSVELRPAAGSVAPAAGRVLLNALLLAGEALPRGGAISLAGEPAGRMLLLIEGPAAAWPAGLAVLLADPASAWAAASALAGPAGMRMLQAPLTALLADAAGVRASMLLSGTADATPPLLLDLSAAH